jgi:hypothetical protein
MIASKKSVRKAYWEKIIANAKSVKPNIKRFVPPKTYTSFNIFTRYGENLLDVKSPYPMTLDEAMNYFKALSISGNY